MLENCIGLQQSLPSEEIYEQNQKFLHSLDLKNARSQDFTDDEYEILRAIAQQCPQEAGLTIDRAKGMLPDWDVLSSWTDYPEENDCMEQRRRTQIKMNLAALTVTPDPARDFIRVRFSSPFSGSIIIFGSAGTPVLSSTGFEQQTELTLSVNSLPAGVYYLSATPVSGERTTARFTVVK